jgi:TPR repeat protein
MWTESEVHAAAILEEVSRRVKSEDWKTHFAAYLAYSMGFSKDVHQHVEFQRRAFEHLKAAARASGDARMYHSVGLHYWQGLNSVARDLEKAREWLEAAANSTEIEAVQSYKRFIRKHPCTAEVRPNPSIERTRPGKPGRASHVKR